MSESAINSALVAAYLESGVMPQEQTAFEGVAYTPKQGQPWARLLGLPSGRSPAAQGKSAPQEWTGILQIDLRYPKNTGTGPVLDGADALLSYFRSGRRFKYQDQSVLIRRAERTQIRQEEAWQVVSVSVSCLAWIKQA